MSSEIDQKDPDGFPSDDAIRNILSKRVGKQTGLAIAIGVIKDSQRRVFAHGQLSRHDTRTPNENTVFEVGSITKVFTAMVLADMVKNGEASLGDAVQDYLPPGVCVPRRNGRIITLVDLCTHMSGLPRMPSNFAQQAKDSADPYSTYTVDHLYQFLATHELARDIGSAFEYSNLGAGLLGHALSRRAGVDYATLVQNKISTPLGLDSTAVALSPDQGKRLAPGHNATFEPTAYWNLGEAFAGAGALRSTVNDQLTLLEFMLEERQSSFNFSVHDLLAVRRDTRTPALSMALGWMVHSTRNGDVVAHEGATAGFRAFVGFSREKKFGLVLLSNAAREVGDIGMHLLDPSISLKTPSKQRQEISLPPSTLNTYKGRYRLRPEFILTITTEDNRLFAQAAGQSKAEIYAESEHFFFSKVVDAQFTFEIGVDGTAILLTLHQNGRDIPGTRIEE